MQINETENDVFIKHLMWPLIQLKFVDGKDFIKVKYFAILHDDITIIFCKFLVGYTFNFD